MHSNIIVALDATVIFTINIIDYYNHYILALSQSVTTKEGNGFKTETTLSADLKAIRVYEFTDTGMVVVSISPIEMTILYDISDPANDNDVI